MSDDIHTCHDECPCQGGEPAPDFEEAGPIRLCGDCGMFHRASEPHPSLANLKYRKPARSRSKGLDYALGWLYEGAPWAALTTTTYPGHEEERGDWWDER